MTFLFLLFLFQEEKSGMHATTRITNTLTVHNTITVIDTWMQWVCWGMTMTMNGTENTVLSFHQFHEHQ